MHKNIEKGKHINYYLLMVIHPFEPIYDNDSKVLILGSFPSVVSREVSFYYGNKKNRFWKVMLQLFGTADEINRGFCDNEERKNFVLKNHIALWDVIKSCEITGSSDSTIKNVVGNDIQNLLDKTGIERIFCNGTKSFELYNKYIYKKGMIEAGKLPSTSPANAHWSLDNLVEAWQVIKEM